MGQKINAYEGLRTTLKEDHLKERGRPCQRSGGYSTASHREERD